MMDLITFVPLFVHFTANVDSAQVNQLRALGEASRFTPTRNLGRQQRDASDKLKSVVYKNFDHVEAEGGYKCSQPNTYRGTEYGDECTDINSNQVGRFWCATEGHVFRTAGYWEYCDDTVSKPEDVDNKVGEAVNAKELPGKVTRNNDPISSICAEGFDGEVETSWVKGMYTVKSSCKSVVATTLGNECGSTAMDLACQEPMICDATTAKCIHGEERQLSRLLSDEPYSKDPEPECAAIRDNKNFLDDTKCKDSKASKYQSMLDKENMMLNNNPPIVYCTKIQFIANKNMCWLKNKSCGALETEACLEKIHPSTILSMDHTLWNLWKSGDCKTQIEKHGSNCFNGKYEKGMQECCARSCAISIGR